MVFCCSFLMSGEHKERWVGWVEGRMGGGQDDMGGGKKPSYNTFGVAMMPIGIHVTLVGHRDLQLAVGSILGPTT